MTTTHTESRLAAVFYADVVGYSRLMARDERATYRLLVTYLDALAAAIAEYGDSVVDFAGDAVLVYFGSL
jgi:adenylate cyclase